MKLDRDTKYDVSPGDYIKFKNGDLYFVEHTIKTIGFNHAVQYTMIDTKDKRRLYAFPSSKCYGAEIIKGDLKK